MTNYNGQQLPPDAEFDNIIPQTMNTTDKVEKLPAFDSRNYLDFSIPDGQKTREINIRLLPIKTDGDKPEFFQIVHLHNISVNKELNPNKSGKKAYMCLGPKNTGIDHSVYGSKCPVCEEQQELWNKWHEETDEVKKKALIDSIKQLNIREYCIVRCIERGKEEDGPKFWRIPLRQDQTDAYHKIILLYETRKKEGEEAGVKINIFSLYEGRDLKITFTEGTGAPTVVDKSVSTPVTKDNEQLIKLYYDDKKWSDVFSTKPYDYLKIAFEGEVPWYDKVNKCWVSKTDFEKNKSSQEKTFNEEIKKAESQFLSTPIIPQSTINVEEQPFTSSVNYPNVDDELPF
jgi:hypothetical protein